MFIEICVKTKKGNIFLIQKKKQKNTWLMCKTEIESLKLSE